MTQIIDRPPLRGDGTPEPDGPILTELPSVTTLTRGHIQHTPMAMTKLTSSATCNSMGKPVGLSEP